jgi:hypothetical protein
MDMGFVGKEAEEALDEYDLKQLPDVDEELKKRLKEQGYETLWEVVFEDAEVLAVAAVVKKGAAEKITTTANMLLRLEEEEAG